MNFLNKIELYHSIIVFSLCDIRTSSSSPVLEMTKDKGKKKKKKDCDLPMLKRKRENKQGI